MLVHSLPEMDTAMHTSTAKMAREIGKPSPFVLFPANNRAWLKSQISDSKYLQYNKSLRPPCNFRFKIQLKTY